MIPGGSFSDDDLPAIMAGMKQVLIQRGEVVVAETPAPKAGPGEILVRVCHSCISVGTEMASVESSAPPLYQRVLKQRHPAEKFLKLVRDQGMRRTWSFLKGDFAAGTPVGYSAAGVVIETGERVVEFRPGDLVACAGAEIANHAEIINVPVNLAVKIPQGLSTKFASTVTLGAIALQGVRRCNPTIGETVYVVGLGILGQITAQLLRANGCRVIGVDVDSRRVACAVDSGLAHGIDPLCGDPVEQVHQLTEGMGADAVIITAATPSHQVVSEAMNACRKKGRVVLVGNVGLHLKRQDFYKKELDFLISCSYGPGRYDPNYETEGQDYPLPYVRWTENRNMEAYLRLLSAESIRIGGLPSQTHGIDDAARAYEAIRSSSEKPLLVFLEYPGQPDVHLRKVSVRTVAAKSGRTRVAVIGAGGFAQGVHLPNLIKLRNRFEIRAVMSRSGPKAVSIARQYEAAYGTTEIEDVLNDGEIDLVIICTRHNLHGPLALRALMAGKHVLVEKPLCIHPAELGEIQEFFAGGGKKPVLTTGFNRRFSPPVARAREWLDKRRGPLMINYRMNAGYIPPDHWVQGKEGGGRNIGEACHIYDLFNFLVGSEFTSVKATPLLPASGPWSRTDNFVATLGYGDGSVCTLTYTALGSKDYPKEQMEVFVDKTVIALDDFRAVRIVGAKHRGWHSATPEKGQLQELQAVGDCLQSGREWPIPLHQQIAVMEACFEVEKQLSLTGDRNAVPR